MHEIASNTSKKFYNILKIFKSKINPQNDSNPGNACNELIRHTVSELFKDIEDMTLQIANAPDMIADIAKLNSELSWVLEEIDDIEKVLDSLVEYVDIAKMDTLTTLSNKKLVEDYCNFLHFLRHDIVGHLVLTRSFFIDIDSFSNKTVLLMREIRRTQIIAKRVRILILSLENNIEDFDMCSLMRYIKSVNLS